MADKRRSEGARARPDQGEVAHRWRIHPAVDKELDDLGDEDAVSIHAQMLIVRQDGLRASPTSRRGHLRGRGARRRQQLPPPLLDRRR